MFKEIEDYKLNYYFKSLLTAYNKILSLLEYSDEQLHKPLTDAILQDPNSTQVKFILYLYSMEPFIGSALNIAS